MITFALWLCVFSGAAALMIALVAAALRPRTIAQWTFFLGMVALGTERFFQAASLASDSLARMLAWQQLTILPLAVVPGLWLVFSLTFARGNHREFLRRWMLVIAVLVIAPVMFAVTEFDSWVIEAVWKAQAGNWFFPVNSTGKAFHLLLVIGSVLVITNLEWTFRAAVGTTRWKLKFAVIGIALIFGVRIYASSQVILYSANTVPLILLNSLAQLLACVMLGVWAYRSRLAHVDLYPATVLHRSFTVLLAGAYLVVVGVLARLVSAVGGDESFPVKALIILLMLVGLGVLGFSDRVRHATRHFVSRHFQRPVHDYRQVWSTFTQQTAAVLDKTEFARASAKVISDTFEALTVTIWFADPVRSRLTLMASTSLESQVASAAPLAEDLLQRMMPADGTPGRPMNLDRLNTDWATALKSANPAYFPEGGHRYCLPLVFAGEAVGLLVVGDRVNGQPFTPEDLELLKCLGDQISAGARNVSLSERLVAAKELEAFQAMSAFLIHDLKNTASALTLTLRNLPDHFENPAFREDALRTLGKSVERVNELIGRLTTLRQKLEIRSAPADLNAVVTTVLGSTPDLGNVSLVRKFEPVPLLPLDTRQFESVVLNLLLNARDAVAGKGEIQITTGCEDGWATLSVSDNGCGMAPDFLAHSLFRPFKTTKRNGLGIGMFQVKSIVEAHRGKIAVESETGKGTTFRISLPLRSQ